MFTDGGLACKDQEILVIPFGWSLKGAKRRRGFKVQPYEKGPQYKGGLGTKSIES